MRQILYISLMSSLLILCFSSCKEQGNPVGNQNKPPGTSGTPPSPPYNLKALAISQSEINLSWFESSVYVAGYRIERFETGGWHVLDSTQGNFLSYNDNGLQCNTVYSYRVAAFNPGGLSTPSNDASAGTLGDALVREPVASMYDLHAVVYTSSGIGYAVGDHGTLLRSSNGGINWDSVSVGTTYNVYLYDIFFSGSDTGMAVGSRGTILSSTNAGMTWTQQTRSTYDLMAVTSVGPSTWIAVGGNGTILRTTDGGSSWTNRVSGTAATLRGVSFAGQKIGTIVGLAGIILGTTDGGVSWVRQTASGIQNNPLYAVAFSDPASETIVGSSGLVLRSNDQGSTWYKQPSGTSSSLYAISYVDANGGIIVGNNGAILQTINSGRTWVNQLDPVKSDLYGICYRTRGSATAVGRAGTVVLITLCGQ